MELSTRCQAACPMCGRNNHGGLPNPNLLLDDMSLDLFKKIVNKDVLQQVGHYCFCGNYGDPMINNDLPDICEYIKNGKAACTGTTIPDEVISQIDIKEETIVREWIENGEKHYLYTSKNRD